VSTSSLNIHISKLVKIVVANARFGNTCKFKVLFTIAGNNSSTRLVCEGNETRGHWHKTNLLNQMFLILEIF
jgi:hypothetical protein